MSGVSVLQNLGEQYHFVIYYNLNATRFVFSFVIFICVL